MEETYLVNHPGVKKKILSGGKGPLPHFPPGAKLVFHFQALKDDFERTVIDDSRWAKRPMEIFVGKMFKMEVWEVLLTSMRIGEVAEFWCDAVHTGLYPIVSKGMRMIAQGKDPLEGQRHMCGMGNMFQYHSTGYPELDELMKEPQPLIFIMELLSVGDPTSFHRESWMMEKDEKLEAVPPLHVQGNILVKQGRYREAASRYQEAVLMLRTVQSREMPGDEDYIKLDRLVIPLVLNYCQCMLELEEYYEVIEHTTELLEKHKDCLKAYYKRAKAHAAVWNEKEARRDYQMVMELDITLAGLVHRELQQLSQRMKEKYLEERKTYWNKLEKGKKKDEADEEGEEADEEGKEEGAGGEEEKEEEEEEISLTEMVKTKEIDADSVKLEAAVTAQEESKAKEVKEESAAKEVKEESATNEKPAGGSDGETGANKNTLLAFEGKDWQQLLTLTMHLQKEGNFYMEDRHYDVAAEKFKEALDYVNYLQTKRVPYKGEDWESLEKVQVPLMLNLSQCRLEQHEYEQVVELTSRLLKRHKGNMRALYQRARAHCALYHEQEAKKDLAKIQRRYPKFQPVVRHELKRLGERVRAKSVQDKKNYWTTLEEKYSPVDKVHAQAKKTTKRKKAVKWTDQAVKKEEAEKRSGDGEGEGEGEGEGTSAENKEERGVAEEAVGEEAEGAAVASGSHHTSSKQDKASAVSGALDDKANKTARSGEDKMAEGAPLTTEAPAASGISKGIKGANEIKVQSKIKRDLANENPPNVAGSAVQTASANKVEPAPVTESGGCERAGAVETDRLAKQTDGPGKTEKEKAGAGETKDVKKKTAAATPDTKGASKGAGRKAKTATPSARPNKPPTHAPKQRTQKKK